jgi:S1-C subfamily serine protease
MSTHERIHRNAGIRFAALIPSCIALTVLSACASLPAAQVDPAGQGKISLPAVLSPASKAKATPILWPVPFPSLGLTLRDLAREELERRHLPYGVLVEAVSDDAEYAGIRPGDVIVAVNQETVPSLQRFWEVVETAGQRVAIVIVRGDDLLRFELFNLDV